MSTLRQILLTCVLLAAFGGGWWAWNEYAREATDNAQGRPGGGAISVIVGNVEERTLLERVEAVGTSRARQAIEIVPLDEGQLSEILFAPGANVEAGTILARLDADIQRADVEEAVALLREKDLALERARTLRTTAAIPQATIEQLEAERAAAQARLERAERRLTDRDVRAPFSGMVGLRRVDVGARVTETTVLTTLDDLSEIEIAFQLPERLFGRIRADQPVTARAAAFGDDAFVGRIATIDSRIDPTARSFQVRAVLPNPDLALPAGMFMHLEVVLEERIALVVPESAVVVEGDRSFVYAVENERAVRRNVRVGARELGIAEILEGLEVEAVVVVQGVTRVRDGVPVNPIEDGSRSVPSAEPIVVGGSGGAPA